MTARTADPYCVELERLQEHMRDTIALMVEALEIKNIKLDRYEQALIRIGHDWQGERGAAHAMQTIARIALGYAETAIGNS